MRARNLASLFDRTPKALGEIERDSNELDANVLDNVDRASARFDALGRQLLDA